MANVCLCHLIYKLVGEALNLHYGNGFQIQLNFISHSWIIKLDGEPISAI